MAQFELYIASAITNPSLPTDVCQRHRERLASAALGIPRVTLIAPHVVMAEPRQEFMRKHGIATFSRETAAQIFRIDRELVHQANLFWIDVSLGCSEGAAYEFALAASLGIPLLFSWNTQLRPDAQLPFFLYGAALEDGVPILEYTDYAQLDAWLLKELS